MKLSANENLKKTTELLLYENKSLYRKKENHKEPQLLNRLYTFPVLTSPCVMTLLTT